MSAPISATPDYTRVGTVAQWNAEPYRSLLLQPGEDVHIIQADGSTRVKIGDGKRKLFALPYLDDALVRRVAAAENPLAADYWATAFTPPATPPTISGNPSTPTIASGVAVVPARLGGSNANDVDMAGDTHFRYGGTPVLSPVGASTTFVVPPLLPDGAAQAARWTPAYEFVTDAANTVFELVFRAATTAIGLRLMVDGQWVTDQSSRVTGFTAGGTAYVKVDYAAVAKARNVKVFVDGASGFRGVVVPAGQTVTRPGGALTNTWVAIGDSFVGGAGNPPDGAGRLETWPNFVAKLAGADQFVNMGIGGTGHQTTSPYINRIQDALGFNPRAVMLFGSRNDGAAPGIGDAVRAELLALTSVPQVYVIGPVTAAYSAGSEQIKAAALEFGRPFIDGVNGPGGPFLTGADIGTDNIHPIFPAGYVPVSGHKKLGDKVWRAIRPYELAAA